MFASPARKNPGVDRITFEALERRVAELERTIKTMAGEPAGDAQRRRRKPSQEQDSEE